MNTRALLLMLALPACCVVELAEPPPLVVGKLDTEGSTGSAVAYKSEEEGDHHRVYFLTAQHMLTDRANYVDMFLVSRGISERPTRVTDIRVEYQDTSLDVAVISGLSPAPVPRINILSRAPTYREPLEAYGCPAGIDPVVTLGYAVRRSTMHPSKWLTTAQAVCGSSGGGVFTPDGALMGITSMVFGTQYIGGSDTYPYLHLFTPVAEFHDDLEKRGLL